MIFTLEPLASNNKFTLVIPIISSVMKCLNGCVILFVAFFKTFSAGNTNLQCWGPYRSSSNELYKELLLNETPSFVLFGSGSGFGYISDVLSILAYRIRENKNNLIPSVQIHYSARTAGLLYNFSKEVQEKLEVINEKNIASIKFQWYLTSDDQQTDIAAEFANSPIEIVQGKLSIIFLLKKSVKAYLFGQD